MLIHPPEPVANHLNPVEAIHPSDCKPQFVQKVFGGTGGGVQLYEFTGWSILVMPCCWRKLVADWLHGEAQRYPFDNERYPRYAALELAWVHTQIIAVLCIIHMCTTVVILHYSKLHSIHGRNRNQPGLVQRGSLHVIVRPLFFYLFVHQQGRAGKAIHPNGYYTMFRCHHPCTHFGHSR